MSAFRSTFFVHPSSWLILFSPLKTSSKNSISHPTVVFIAQISEIWETWALILSYEYGFFSWRERNKGKVAFQSSLILKWSSFQKKHHVRKTRVFSSFAFKKATWNTRGVYTHSISRTKPPFCYHATTGKTDTQSG